MTNPVTAKDNALAFRLFADSYYQDAKTLMNSGGMNSFNVSGYIDDGSSSFKFAPIDASRAKDPATGISSSLLFLMGHAIELYMKAIMLNSGTELEEVKQISHDLCRALGKIESFGIELKHKPVIKKFAKYHYRMEYRYPKGSRLEFVNPEELENACIELSEITQKTELSKTTTLHD